MSLMIQAFFIFGFSILGDIISKQFNLPIPGSVIGIILLFSGLYFNIIKLKQVEALGTWLKDHMVILFIPITVGLMEEFELIAPHLLELTVIMMVTTAVTYISVAWVVEKVTHDR